MLSGPFATSKFFCGFGRQTQLQFHSKLLRTANMKGRVDLVLRRKLSQVITELPVSRMVVGKWLIGLAGMTWGAVALGGLTRLTESGLSMVDWHPFKEAPPRTREQWMREFEKYKQFPEHAYQEANHGEMSLSRFKFIWYMEYCHRMWGRSIGAVFLLPALYFAKKGYFSRAMKPRVFVYGSLIGLQGLLGWLMVRSGLKDPTPPAGHNPEEPFQGVPRVQHYWLCAHLSSAIILYSLFLWAGLNHLVEHNPVPRFSGLKRIKILAHSSKALSFLTLIYGAFVAGMDAGLTYNSWPKMADRWIPDDIVTPRYGSVLRNCIDNPTAVQFIHRSLAYATVLAGTALWASVMHCGPAATGPRLRLAAHFVLASVIGQSTMGIITLIHHVPTALASMHQNGSLVLMTSLLWFTHCLRAVPK